jgi:flagellar export protein FliJ
MKEREAERLDEMQNNNEAALNEAGKTTKARATDLQANRAFLQKLDKQIHDQEKKMQTISHNEDAKRQVLLEKSQEKRVVEILDERREAEELKEMEKKYQRVIDMLAQRMRFEF